MSPVFVAGCGTDVGKTVVAAILTTLLKGDYWKPVQCGDEKDSDSNTMSQLIDMKQHFIYPSAYSFKTPVSPHHAARLENISIETRSIIPPQTSKPLVIEGVGGILVPLLKNFLTIDLFKRWGGQWVVVSRHYVGSINHTLLTLEVLKQHQVRVLGVIFNGSLNLDSEAAILENGRVPFLGRVLPEQTIDSQTIQKYAQQWQQQSLLF